MTTAFTETTIDCLIDAVEHGANIANLIAMVEAAALIARIDLNVAPAVDEFIRDQEDDEDEGHHYRAYTDMLVAIYVGLKHHQNRISGTIYEGTPFLDYANSPLGVFGMSPFLIETESENEGVDMGEAAELSDMGMTEGFDMTTARDNRHVDWADWLKCVEDFPHGVETWIDCFGGFQKELCGG